MTSANTFPRRFTEVDELIRPDHRLSPRPVGRLDRGKIVREGPVRAGAFPDTRRTRSAAVRAGDEP